MPRVDEGLKAADIADILKLGGELNKVVEWALESGVILVTRPSLVYVYTGKGSPARLTLGTGSIIYSREPPISLRSYTISRPEWVDGCKTGASEPSYEVAEGPVTRLEGSIMSLDYSDPASQLINGLIGPFGVVDRDKVLVGAVATLDGRPILYRVDSGYLSLLKEGEPRRRLDYIAPLASSCKWR